MGQVEVMHGAERPLWRRIADYPLVAMLIAIGLYILGIILAGFIAGLLWKLVLPSNLGIDLQTLVEILAVPALVIIYKLAIRHLGEHPRDDFKDPKALRHLILGIAAGLVIFSVAVGIAALMGVYTIKGPGDLTGLLAALVGSAIFPAVNEELLFRGILFRWIEEFGGSLMALIVSSVLFGAAHAFNPDSSVIATSFIAIEAGIMLGAAYMLTRSLWLPMGLHAAWNFAQGEIWDIPVSGTSVHGMIDARLCCDPLLTGNGFGLEASPIALVIATAFGLWLLWLAIRKGQLVPPMWVRRRLARADQSSSS